MKYYLDDNKLRSMIWVRANYSTLRTEENCKQLQLERRYCCMSREGWETAVRAKVNFQEV
jgi:hypothetical protein